VLFDAMPATSTDKPSLQRRLLQPCDFDEALGFLPRWLAMDSTMRAQLPELWRELLQHPGFNADVIEDVGAPQGERIQAIGMAVALDEPWQRRLRAAPPPWITHQLYADLIAGRTRPPTEREMAVANASTGDDEGVTFMVLHYQQRNADLADPRAVAVLSAGLTAMRVAHAGHRVREIFQEAWQSEQAYMRSIGLVQRSAHNARECAEHQQRLPELFSLTRAEALQKLPGFQLRETFEHSAPIFHFRGAEQRLLRRALFDEPDEAIAALLAISPHTLKKLWRSIYERVEDRFPRLLADAAVASSEGVRGPEKRRTLMRYLRQHPEELRPHAMPGVAARAQQEVPHADSFVPLPSQDDATRTDLKPAISDAAAADLAAVVDTLRFDPALHFQARLDASGGFSIDSRSRAALYMVLGEPVLGRHPGSGWQGELRDGDLLFLPRGGRHDVAGSANTRLTTITELVGRASGNGRRCFQIDHPAAVTLLVGSFFWTRDLLAQPLLARLPDVVPIRGNRCASARWLGPMGELMRWMTDLKGGGGGVGMDESANALLRHVLLAWLRDEVEPVTNAEPTRLAERDDALGPALRAIHTAPEQDWSIERLATICHMSRTAFALRFSRALGEAPLRYLTRWRMTMARQLLANRQLSLDQVAQRVGYSSGFAFSKAYKRETNASPRGGTEQREAA